MNGDAPHDTMQVQLAKAGCFLSGRDAAGAVAVFKGFERKESSVRWVAPPARRFPCVSLAGRTDGGATACGSGGAGVIKHTSQRGRGAATRAICRRARAATSLSFLYLLEGRHEEAAAAVDLALAADRLGWDRACVMAASFAGCMLPLPQHSRRGIRHHPPSPLSLCGST